MIYYGFDGMFLLAFLLLVTASWYRSHWLAELGKRRGLELRLDAEANRFFTLRRELSETVVELAHTRQNLALAAQPAKEDAPVKVKSSAEARKLMEKQNVLEEIRDAV